MTALSSSIACGAPTRAWEWDAGLGIDAVMRRRAHARVGVGIADAVDDVRE